MTNVVRPLILIGAPRTGSTLLATLLLQHPDIHMHGELFHPEMSERQRTHSLRGRSKAWFDEDVDDPVDFLVDHVFGINRDYQGRVVHTVGFKLLLTRRTTPDAELLLRIREAFPSLAVLHIRRENYLDSLISREFAERGKQWIAWSHLQEPRSDISAFSVSLARARQHFENSHEVDCLIEETFAGPGYRAIFYEDLVEHLDTVMGSVFNFLNVAERDVGTVTDKQVGEADLDLVRNLAHLRSEYAAFRSTTSVPRRRTPVGVEVPPYASRVSSELSAMDSGTLRRVLVLASRGVRPTGIARRLEASEIEADRVQIRRICRRVGHGSPGWLSRALPEGVAAVYLFSAQGSTELEGTDGPPERPVLGIGVSATGKRLVLGAWRHESAIDLRARGLRRALLAVGDQQALNSAGVEADAQLNASLTLIKERLRGLRGEEFRKAGAALATEIGEDQQLSGLALPLRSVLLPVVRLEQIRRGFAAATTSRSQLTAEQTERRLRFFAQSLDPLARDDTRWRAWKKHHTDLATRELNEPFTMTCPEDS